MCPFYILSSTSVDPETIAEETRQVFSLPQKLEYTQDLWEVEAYNWVSDHCKMIPLDIASSDILFSQELLPSIKSDICSTVKQEFYTLGLISRSWILLAFVVFQKPISAPDHESFRCLA
jgi:hypothetical protein